ncbi:MAG: biotin/lipoyl-binding protein, partial [Bifidobacteriaceae bacterium]|nr:biotin/lipoyl-binding protein [Bifidobacteriaceae bacterium]
MKQVIARARERRGQAPAGATARPRRRRRRVVVAVMVGLLVLGGAGTGAYALVRPSGPEYRTAVAGTGSVVQQASGVGTVGIVSEHSAAFQVAGTIGAVEVAVGDAVTAGQALATLDPTDLDESVQTAEEELAEAED